MASFLQVIQYSGDEPSFIAHRSSPLAPDSLNRALEKTALDEIFCREAVLAYGWSDLAQRLGKFDHGLFRFLGQTAENDRVAEDRFLVASH